MLLSVLLVTACTAAGAPAPSPAPSADASPTLSASVQRATPTPAQPLPALPPGELLFDGSLLICSDLPYPPQEFFDERGNPVGSDVEIGEEIARRLGLQARIVNSIFDTIIDALNGGKCDIVISAQNITAERQAQVDMIPYFQAGQAFILRRGNPAGIHTELDLCGRRVGAQSGTVQVDVVLGTGENAGQGLTTACAEHGKPAILLREFDKDDEALAALKADDVDTYFVDSPAAGYHVVQDSDGLELADLTLDVAVQGISVPKDRPALNEAVRTALASMMDDGTYVEILARYGVQDGSVAEVVRR